MHISNSHNSSDNSTMLRNNRPARKGAAFYLLRVTSSSGARLLIDTRKVSGDPWDTILIINMLTHPTLPISRPGESCIYFLIS